MQKLITPFGDIEIKIDGQLIDYDAKEGKKIETLCPDVIGRYQIRIEIPQDRKKHRISCTFLSDSEYERTPESGERLECNSFYNSKDIKMSIGLEGETWSVSDKIASEEYGYDYDIEYLENGMSYIILETTKTTSYVFGIAWIDRVSWNNSQEDETRDVQTWFGADPTILP